MKTILAVTAIMGFSVSLAAAECAGHAKVNAAVDTETTVASVAQPVTPVPAPEEIKTEETTQQ